MTQQFASNLKNDEAMVRGLRIDVWEETTTKVSSLSRTREEFLARANAIAKRNDFTMLGENLGSSNQGTKRLSLPWFWASVASYIVKYLTCNGR